MSLFDLIVLASALVIACGLLLLVSRLLPLREQSEADGLADIMSRSEAKVERKQQKTRSLFRRARQAMKRGVLSSAEELLYQATGLDEADPQLLRQLVETLSGQGKLDKARIAAEKLATLSPTQGHLILLAEILLQLGMQNQDHFLLQQSRDSFDRVLAEDPMNTSALNGMAEYTKYSGDHQGAFEYWRRSYTADTSQKGVGLKLVTHYVDYYEAEELAETWTTLLNHFPTDQDIIAARMRQLISDKQLTAALALYDPLEEKVEVAPELIRLASLCYYQQKDYQHAAALLEKIIADAPSAMDYYNLALAQFHQRSYDSAVVTLQSAIDQNANDVRFHLLMGKIHYGAGDKVLAARDFTRALELEPKHYEALRYLKRVS